MMVLQPVIAVCGTTGVGKSRLAVEIAQWLSASAPKPAARIINADSMQVYTGMDAITNKIPHSERHGVEHLLMDFKQPGEQYVVGEWVRDAVLAIEETHARRQVPIVVGGTSYWMQHLLFLNSLPSTAQSKRSQSPPSPALTSSINALPDHLSSLFHALPTTPPSASNEPELAFTLHSLLSLLDPVTAARWHWKDTRKVLRSLQLIVEHGRKVTEVFADQSKCGMTPRYRTLIFWLYADPLVLNSRLDRRVEQMVEQGLLDEIRALRQLVYTRPPTSEPSQISNVAGLYKDSSPLEKDFTLGIYQAIGYKEFHPYLSSPDATPALLQAALMNMKHNTKKYAQRQIKWIRNKLLPASQAANADSRAKGNTDMVSTFLLDATDMSECWGMNVTDTATQITQAFLSNVLLPDPFSLSATARVMLKVPDKPTDPSDTLLARRKLVCSVCTADPSRPVMLEEGREWEAHERTTVHRRLARKSSTVFLPGIGKDKVDPQEEMQIYRKRMERRERKHMAAQHLESL